MSDRGLADVGLANVGDYLRFLLGGGQIDPAQSLRAALEGLPIPDESADGPVLREIAALRVQATAVSADQAAAYADQVAATERDRVIRAGGTEADYIEALQERFTALRGPLELPEELRR